MESVHLGSRNRKSDAASNCTSRAVIDAAVPSSADTGSQWITQAVVKREVAASASISGPQALPYGPPGHARPCYKLVLLRDDSMPLSIHNGRTQYPIGCSFVQTGEDQGMKSGKEMHLELNSKPVFHLRSDLLPCRNIRRCRGHVRVCQN